MPLFPIAGGSRRKFWIYSTLVFFAGLIIGLLVGVYGLRYLFWRFPPHPEEMTRRTAERIRKDFGLDPSAQARLEKEGWAFFEVVKEKVDRTRDEIDEKLKEHVVQMADIFPAGETRERWLKEYPNYFPKRPPPPPGFPPPGHSPGPPPGVHPRRD